MKDPLHYETLAGYYNTAAAHARVLGSLLIEDNRAETTMYAVRRELDKAQKALEDKHGSELSLTEMATLHMTLGRSAQEFQAAVTRKADLGGHVRAARKQLADVQSLIRDWYAGEEVAQQLPGFSQ